MFYGFTESESFTDPTILNAYPQEKLVIEKRSDGKGYWHIIILKIRDEDIQSVTQTISHALKPDWNAMFYTDDVVYAVFKDRIFTLKNRPHWELPNYEEVKHYAKEHNVGDLDMNKVFTHYRALLA